LKDSQRSVLIPHDLYLSQVVNSGYGILGEMSCSRQLSLELV
jgi:hypothetical protein